MHPSATTSGRPLTHSNRWRWTYERPREAKAQGLEAAKVMRGVTQGFNARSLERQRDTHRRTGFAGDWWEFAHELKLTLQERGFTRTEAEAAAHLVSCAEEWNFMGVARIAAWMGVSPRTVRRCFAQLVKAGLIAAYILLPGDQIPGQRAPVSRVQVVRDVRALRALLPERNRMPRGKLTPRRRGPVDPSARRGASSTKHQGPSAAHVPKPAESAPEPMTSEMFEALAAKCVDPKLSAIFHATAAAKRAQARYELPDEDEDTLPDLDLDAIDADIQRSERELLERQQRERPPPE